MQNHDNFKIEFINIDSLKNHPRNYKTHTDDQINHIISSLKKYGFYKNIIISNDNYILAGHGVVEACKRIKLKKIPVYKINYTHNDKKALAILVGDNELTNRAIVNDLKLLDLLNELKINDISLLEGTGYNEQMILALEELTKDQFEKTNLISEIETSINYKEGDPYYQIIINFDNENERNIFLETYKENIVSKRNIDKIKNKVISIKWKK